MRTRRLFLNRLDPTTAPHDVVVVIDVLRSFTTGRSVTPLAGKKGPITGVANDKSIAFAVAKAVRELGAEIALTYQNDKTAKYTQPLAESLGVRLFEKLDVSQPGSMEAVIEKVGTEFGQIDFAIPALTSAMHDDLHGPVNDTTEEGFDAACCALPMPAWPTPAPLMSEGGSLITMAYLRAERVAQRTA